MLRDFQAAFRPSRWRRIFLLILFFCTLFCIVWYFSGTPFWLLCTLLCATSAWAWRDPNPVRHLQVDADFQAWLLLNDDEHLYAATLLSGSLIHRWGCCLRWQCAERIFWQWVLPDMLDADAFRRLRVWAAFGQKQ